MYTRLKLVILMSLILVPINTFAGGLNSSQKRDCNVLLELLRNGRTLSTIDVSGVGKGSLTKIDHFVLARLIDKSDQELDKNVLKGMFSYMLNSRGEVSAVDVRSRLNDLFAKAFRSHRHRAFIDSELQQLVAQSVMDEDVSGSDSDVSGSDSDDDDTTQLNQSMRKLVVSNSPSNSLGASAAFFGTKQFFNPEGYKPGSIPEKSLAQWKKNQARLLRLSGDVLSVVEQITALMDTSKIKGMGKQQAVTLARIPIERVVTFVVHAFDDESYHDYLPVWRQEEAGKPGVTKIMRLQKLRDILREKNPLKLKPEWASYNLVLLLFLDSLDSLSYSHAGSDSYQALWALQSKFNAINDDTWKRFSQYLVSLEVKADYETEGDEINLELAENALKKVVEGFRSVHLEHPTEIIELIKRMERVKADAPWAVEPNADVYILFKNLEAAKVKKPALLVFKAIYGLSEAHIKMDDSVAGGDEFDDFSDDDFGPVVLERAVKEQFERILRATITDKEELNAVAEVCFFHIGLFIDGFTTASTPVVSSAPPSKQPGASSSVAAGSSGAGFSGTSATGVNGKRTLVSTASAFAPPETSANAAALEFLQKFEESRKTTVVSRDPQVRLGYKSIKFNLGVLTVDDLGAVMTLAAPSDKAMEQYVDIAKKLHFSGTPELSLQQMPEISFWEVVTMWITRRGVNIDHSKDATWLTYISAIQWHDQPKAREVRQGLETEYFYHHCPEHKVSNVSRMFAAPTQADFMGDNPRVIDFDTLKAKIHALCVEKSSYRYHGVGYHGINDNDGYNQAVESFAKALFSMHDTTWIKSLMPVLRGNEKFNAKYYGPEWIKKILSHWISNSFAENRGPAALVELAYATAAVDSATGRPFMVQILKRLEQ